MFELTIKNTVYQFNFGMGFLREVNKRITSPVDGVKNVEQNIGLRYMISNIIDGDVETLVDALDAANKGYEPRVTKNLLDEYIDSEGTDIEQLFTDVLGFFESANATKKTMKNIQEALEREKAKAAANA